MEPSFTRPARDSDHGAIDDLLREVFGHDREARLVRALRDDSLILRESLMPWSDAAAGYLAVVRMVAPQDWVCLAPVAIHPAWQGQGRGEFMVKEMVEAVSEQMGRTMVVVGDGKFYRRCGFLATRAARLLTPYGAGNTLLAGPGMDVPEETLIYPKVFDQLG